MHPRLVCEHGTFEMLVGATYLLIGRNSRPVSLVRWHWPACGTVSLLLGKAWPEQIRNCHEKQPQDKTSLPGMSTRHEHVHPSKTWILLAQSSVSGHHHNPRSVCHSLDISPNFVLALVSLLLPTQSLTGQVARRQNACPLSAVAARDGRSRPQHSDYGQWLLPMPGEAKHPMAAC